MGKKPENEVDDVDDMLNALEVSKPRERARRAPDFTPAPEAIAKAQRQSQPEHRDRKPFAGTIPMPGAPKIPGKQGSNPQLVTDPLEREFLNRPQERARPRRRNDPTMLTGVREEPAPTGSYVKAALITFAAVLAIGLIAWRIMAYIAAQAPAHVDAQDPHLVGANANATASVNPRIVIPPPPVLTDSTANANVPSTAQTTGNQAPNVIATSRPADTAPRATASAASVKSAPTSSNGKGPASKYGGMIDPTAP